MPNFNNSLVSSRGQPQAQRHALPLTMPLYNFAASPSQWEPEAAACHIASNVNGDVEPATVTCEP